VIDPEWGEVVAGPLYDEEGIVMADCDLRRGLYAKRWFDAVGHYSRQEVLTGQTPAEAGWVAPSVADSAGLIERPETPA
jgi:hypothetical protein